MIELIIFDNDGVLVDSEPIANRVLHEILMEAGATMPYEEALRVFKGHSLSACADIARETYGITVSPTFSDDYYSRTLARFETELKPVVGAVALLDQVQIPFCVASNAGRHKLERSLKIVGLADRFIDRIFSVDDVERGKPAPDLFLHAAASCGVEPEYCLVIEDSPQGVQAAQAAGMQVLGYVPPQMPDQLSGLGIPIVHSLLDVLDWLGQHMDA